MRQALILLCLWTFAAAWQRKDANWPQFRGQRATGVAAGHALPVRWDVRRGQHIKWKRTVPGLGLSSPVIWGHRLFLTTAVSKGDPGELRTGRYADLVEDESVHSWKVLCYDKNSGELVWEREVHRGIPEVKRHVKSSHANATIATEGRRLVAFFGSEGLYCLDFDGQVRWKKDFGVLDAGYFRVPEAQWEFGNSPVIYGNKLVVLVDAQKNSFLSVLRLDDGKELWRVPRNDVPTWGAPLVVPTGDRIQIVVNGYRHAGGYDFETGDEIWRVDGGGDIPVPTPIFGRGLFFLTSSHGRAAPVYAVRSDARGNIRLDRPSDERLAWVASRQGSYMQTPLLLGDLLYVSRWQGILSCYRPETGEVVYRERVAPGRFTSSPVGGDGKIYIASEEGEVYVIQAGPEYKALAKNSLGEMTLATPAISEGVIYFRTSRSLIVVE